MSPEGLTEFIANTENDCRLLSTDASVAWEFMGTWGNAIENYFPRYNANGICRGFFAVNVPYMAPILEFENTTNPGSIEFYKVLGDRVVLFKPREWRGVSTSPEPFSERMFLTPKAMAAEINQYPPGTATYIYLTSDGGGNLDMLYDLVANLQPHVRVVNQRALVDVVLQKVALPATAEPIDPV